MYRANCGGSLGFAKLRGNEPEEGCSRVVIARRPRKCFSITRMYHCPRVLSCTSLLVSVQNTGSVALGATSVAQMHSLTRISGKDRLLWLSLNVKTHRFVALSEPRTL